MILNFRHLLTFLPLEVVLGQTSATLKRGDIFNNLHREVTFLTNIHLHFQVYKFYIFNECKSYIFNKKKLHLEKMPIKHCWTENIYCMVASWFVNNLKTFSVWFAWFAPDLVLDLHFIWCWSKYIQFDCFSCGICLICAWFVPEFK